jgi:uncharacterized protein (TIGR02231 family)
MRKTLLAVAAMVNAGACWAVVNGEAPALVTSRIAEVTVFSDRARVTRVGHVTLKEGEAQCSFSRLPGWVDESSVRVALGSSQQGRIADVQVQRDYLARPADEELRKAEAAVIEIDDQAQAMDDEVKVLDAKYAQIEQTKAFSMEKLPKDTAVRDVNIESYGKVVSFVSTSLSDIAKARRDIGKRRRDLEPELKVRKKKLAELQKMAQLEQISVIVTLDGIKGGAVDISLVYMLPGATWEPGHELRASAGDPAKVTIASYAVVTQTTGEDWEGVVLTFSTQSSEETSRIPELAGALLGRAGNIEQMIDGSFLQAQKAYEAQNGIWFNSNNPKEDMNDYYGNNRRQIKTSNRTKESFAKIRIRGTSAQFSGVGKQTIRQDGKSMRVPIGEIELAAVPRIVAAPATSLNAARAVDLINTGKQALLPGNVALFQDSAFLGKTEIDFTAGGEKFSVFMGVADQIKLSRVLDRQNSFLKRGSKNKMQVALDIVVENLSEADVTVELSDRIPVSESKDIEVYRVKIRPEAEPDSKGLVTWKVSLKPKENKTYRLEYTVEYPPVISDKTMSRPSCAPADANSQIMNLELSF